MGTEKIAKPRMAKAMHLPLSSTYVELSRQYLEIVVLHGLLMTRTMGKEETKVYWR